MQEGCEPQLAWKFSNGHGSKDWTTLQDEEAYGRMMKAGAEWVRVQAKKEANLKDPDLGSGWWIDINPTTNVQWVEEVAEEEDMAKEKKMVRKIPTKQKQKKGKKVHIPFANQPYYNQCDGSSVAPEASQASRAPGNKQF